MAKPNNSSTKKSKSKSSFLINKTRLEKALLVVALIFLIIIIGLYFLLNKKSEEVAVTATPIKQLAESEVNQQNTGTPDSSTPSSSTSGSSSSASTSSNAASSAGSTGNQSAPSTPFTVSGASASVSPSDKFLTCNEYQTFTFTGTITATAAGNATYYWTRSDGASGPPTTLNFASAGSKQVTDTWLIGGYNEQGGFTITGWEKVVVTSPNAISSNNAGFTINYGCL